MANKLKSVMFFLLLIAGTSTYAQNDTSIINRNIKALQKYATENPVEKVHLHLDRQLYLPGDTIWFKAYVVIGNGHWLSALSGILYVELINNKDSVINRLSLKIEGVFPMEILNCLIITKADHIA